MGGSVNLEKSSKSFRLLAFPAPLAYRCLRQSTAIQCSYPFPGQPLTTVKTPPFTRQPFQQWRGFPIFLAKLLLIFEHGVVNGFQTNLIGVKHRAAAIDGKAVAIDPDYINIQRARHYAFFQDFCAFIDHRIDRAFENFLVAD